MEKHIKIKIGIFIVATLVIPGIFYKCNFSNSFSTVSSDWGNFGSYYGGIVSTIFSAGTIIFLIFTLIQQRKQLSDEEVRRLSQEKKTAKQMKLTIEQMKTSDKQLELARKQQNSTQFYNMVSQKNYIISTFADEELPGPYIFDRDINIIISKIISSPSTVGQILAKYLNLFNFLITIAKEIDIQHIFTLRDTSFYTKLRYSLSDSELKLLIICIEMKE